MDEFVTFTGSIPENYDKYLGPVLFEPYARDMANRLQNDHLKNVLEIACGTGRLTSHLAKLIPADGQLTAVDLNADMLAKAKTIVAENVHWQVADALNLPFEEKQFDHVVCQFGVMFFPNRQQAFLEAYRVLKSNGKFIFSTWDELKYNPGSGILKNTMENVLKESNNDFIGKGPFSFYDKSEIKSLLEGAGFKSINISTVNFNSTFENVESFIKGFMTGTPISVFFNTQDASLRTSLENQLREKLVPQFGDKNLQFPMQALICEGIK